METPYLSSKAKACRNCAKAKAKCNGIVKTTGKCERCSRLNKEDCVMPVKGNHKSLKMTRNAQIAQLEQKVESLTSILTTTKQIPSPNDASNFRSTSLTGGLLSPSTSAPSREGMQQHKAVHSISARLPSIRNRNPMSSLESCMVNSLPSSSEYTPVYFTDPDKLLNIYRDKLAPQVPYVPIPSKITAHDLMLERPFLSKAVMTAASFENNVHYVELTSGLMKHFIEHIIFRGEKTLDLLQGLIVYINWFHYPLFEIRQMSNLLGLMSGLAADLGISRKRSSTSERHEVFANEIASEFLGNGVEVQDQTLDEKRALLGCFYLLSWATASLSKIDAMRYTPFIKESNEVIARNNGPQSDVFLVHCIKLQCIIERIRNSGLWDGASSKDFQALRAPTAMCVKAFWEELKSFKNSLPPELQNNNFMLKNYYLAEILLFEICFYMDPVPETYNPNSLQRIDIFYACLSATESYFKIFMAAPATTAFSVSVVLCGQMVHAMAVLSKLSLYEAEDWDLTYVRNVCNLSSILARMLERIVATSNAFDSIRGDSYLNTGYRKMEMLKTWYDTKLAAELRGVAPSCAKQGGITDSAGVQVGARAEDAFTANNFDLLGDEFWQAIPGDWDFLQ